MRLLRSTVPVLLGLLTCAAVPLSCRSGGASEPATSASSSPAPRPSGRTEAAEPPSREGPLHKVMDLQVAAADLWHLGGGAILLESNRNFFAAIKGDAVQVLPAMGRGLPPEDGTDDRGSVQMIAGRWPDAVWLVWRDYDTWSAEDNLWYERLFRYRHDHWERIHETRHDQSSNTLYRGLWEQPEGCLVGLLSDDRNESNAWQAHTEILDCPGQPAPTFSFKPTKQTEYGIAAAIGFASGHVVVLEQDTKMKEGEPRAPRLALSRPGPPNRTEIELPLPPEIALDRRNFKLLDCRVFGASPSDLYLVGNYDLGTATIPMLLHFDGTSFAPLPASPIPHIADADLAEDGSLVVLGSPPKENPRARSVWSLARGGAWREMPMPIDRQLGEPYRPWSIAARSSDDVWVVGYHESNERKNRRLALFHSRRPAPLGGSGGRAVP